MNAEPQIRRGRKFEQVVAGARTVFMRDGFEGASVDDIAREAGVSKATLYSYFPDKRVLFIEVAKGECKRMADRAVEMAGQDCPAQVGLLAAARLLVGFLTSPFTQRVFRVCVAEADRFPDLGRTFYTSGPLMGQARLIEFFREAVAKGEMKIDDFELAADQFAELCHADLFFRLVFNMTDKVTEAQIERVAQGAVDTFMARYGS